MNRIEVIDYQYRIKCLRRLLDNKMLEALQKFPMDSSVATSIKILLEPNYVQISPEVQC